MYVQEIATDSYSTNFLGDMGRLIATVGTADFAPTLFEVSRNATGCEHIAVFRRRDATKAELLLSDGTHGGDWPAGRYADRQWRADPLLRLKTDDGTSSITLSWLDQAAHDRAPCQQESERAGQITSRVSLVLRDTDGATHLNLYFRNVAGLHFKAHRFLSTGAMLLGPLLNRHAETPPQADDADMTCPTSVSERLRQIEPTLSERELQVCTHIVRGLTSEGIALELNLSVNTVLTYRKRAYARLRLSTQNELIKLIYGALH